MAYLTRGHNDRSGKEQLARDADSSWSSRDPSDTASLHSMRKRTSLFSRSNSDASSMRRVPATSHSSRPSFSMGRSGDDGDRPGTATSSETRRRKTDPLQSIRDSLFGGKKKPSKEWADAAWSSRPPSRGLEMNVAVEAPVHPTSFRTEEECTILHALALDESHR